MDGNNKPSHTADVSIIVKKYYRQDVGGFFILQIKSAY